MTTIVRWSTSWDGEPLTPGDLLARVERYTLNPDLAELGRPSVANSGMVHFSGNFEEVSGAFGIDTDEPAVIAAWNRAIRRNMARPAYRRALHSKAARGHVGTAQRFEASLSRCLGRGRFGLDAAGDPWPGHDEALCREDQKIADRTWLDAAVSLLELLRC